MRVVAENYEQTHKHTHGTTTVTPCAQRRLIILFIAHLITFIPDGARPKTGGYKGIMGTGDSREEEDTQWRQVITLYTRILRTFADSAYLVT